MSFSSGFTAGRFTSVLAGCLILSLVQDPATLLAAGIPGWHSKRATTVQPLTEEERATHALNRLTFGPRPGDLERIQAIGVKKWVEMQLNPEQIDDSLLEARLQSFPAMRLSQQDLLQAFPPGAVIRAVADGKIGLPDGSGGARNLPEPGLCLRRKAAEAGARCGPQAASEPSPRNPLPLPERARPTR